MNTKDVQKSAFQHVLKIQKSVCFNEIYRIYAKICYYFSFSVEVNAFLKPGHQILCTLVIYLLLHFLKTFFHNIHDLLVARKSLSAPNNLHFGEETVIRGYRDENVEWVIHNVPSK